MNKFFNYLLLASVLISAFACGPKNEDPAAKFDRKAMLQNIADQVIIPNYQVLQQKTAQLDQLAAQFAATPDAAKLAALQQGWKDAALAWQRAEAFEFGPGEKASLRAQLSSFPTQTQQLENRLASGSTFDENYMKSTDNFNKGFPAIEYLIFALNDDTNAILRRFTTDANATKRKEYLKALTNDIKNKVTGVVTEWSASGGNYINTFVNNTGNDVGSSIGFLVNQMSYELDWVSTQKIGIALGKRSLGQIFPEQVEGYYSKMSLAFIKENMKMIGEIYKGKNGLGFDDYLNALGAQATGISLSASIEERINTANQSIALIQPTLPEAIVSNKTVVNTAYDNLKRQLIHFKVDMPSAFGVTITYIDNDGD